MNPWLIVTFVVLIIGLVLAGLVLYCCLALSGEISREEERREAEHVRKEA